MRGRPRGRDVDGGSARDLRAVTSAADDGAQLTGLFPTAHNPDARARSDRTVFLRPGGRGREEASNAGARETAAGMWTVGRPVTCARWRRPRTMARSSPGSGHHRECSTRPRMMGRRRSGAGAGGSAGALAVGALLEGERDLAFADQLAADGVHLEDAAG